MADIFKKVQPGDPLQIQAGTFNAMVDAAQAYRHGSQNVTSTTSRTARRPGTVLVRNDSGEDRARFDILWLADMVYSPTAAGDSAADEQFLRDPVFTGVKQDDLGDGVTESFGVLTEPIKAGEIGTAVIAGLTPARIEFTEDYVSNYDYYAPIAEPKDNLTGFLPGSGNTKVLWTEQKTGTCWALLHLGSSVRISGGTDWNIWARITGAGESGGVYRSWEQVAIDTNNDWVVVPPAEGVTLERLVEANGCEDVPVGTIVYVDAIPISWLESTTEGAVPSMNSMPAGVFAYATETSVGFGKPTGSPLPPTGSTLTLDITDADGTPATGPNGETTITVHKNAARTSDIYYDYAPGGVLSYIRYGSTSGGADGCLFGRTERFMHSESHVPSGGTAILGTESTSVATDITGDASDPEHMAVRGHMYLDAASDGWAPWFVLDPDQISVQDSNTVKTDADDTTAGYLSDELIVTPAAGHGWLLATITPGGTDDNKLLLEHNDWNSDNTTVVGNMLGIDAVGDNVQILAATETPPADSAWFDYYEYEDEYDAKMHGRVKQRPTKKKLVIELPDTDDEKVKASSTDPVAGYLDAKITSGDHWMTVTPGPSSITLAHNSLGTLNNDRYLSGTLGGGNGINVTITAPTDGSPYITGGECIYQWDDKGHGRVIQTGNTIYCSLPCIVRTDAADTTPGYLATKITIDPGDGSTPALQTSVIPGGAAINKLLIEHTDWDAANADPGEEVRNVLTFENLGGGATLDIAEPVPGYAWIHIDIWKHQQDVKGHGDLLPRQGAATPIYIKWVAVPEGMPGDMLYWSDGQWTLLSAPASLSVLVNDGSSPRWEPVEEFTCPGST